MRRSKSGRFCDLISTFFAYSYVSDTYKQVHRLCPAGRVEPGCRKGLATSQRGPCCLATGPLRRCNGNAVADQRRPYGKKKSLFRGKNSNEKLADFLAVEEPGGPYGNNGASEMRVSRREVVPQNDQRGPYEGLRRARSEVLTETFLFVFLQQSGASTSSIKLLSAHIFISPTSRVATRRDRLRANRFNLFGWGIYMGVYAYITRRSRQVATLLWDEYHFSDAGRTWFIPCSR